MSEPDPPGTGPGEAFRALFEALPIGAVLFDPDTDGFVAVNDAACAQLGYDRESFAVLRLEDIDATYGRDENTARRRSLRPGMPALRFSARQRARDGSLRHADVTLQCIEVDGRRLGYAVWHDGTERERVAAVLREREAALARVQRIGHLGGFEIDLRDGAFSNRRSPEYLQLHGLPEAAVFEPHDAWVQRLHPDDRLRADACFRAAVDGGATEYTNEYRIATPTGGVRWIRALAEIERDAGGRPLRMVGAHLDVTDQKHADARLAEQAAHLAEQAAHLAEQAAHLLEADRRKDEFLAVLSHELRNPLAALTNALSLLARSDAPPGSPSAMVEIGQRQVRQLTRLVDDLLEVSRINAGKIVLRLRPLPIAQVVREAMESVGPAFAARGQSLVLLVGDPSVQVVADRARVIQILENLLGNASKYSESGGSVRVWLRAESGVVEIAVEDDGAGIPTQALGRVFEMFSQVDEARDRARGGLGIGLALVRRLVTMHGGSVAVHSDGPGRGARFTVRLPRA